MASSCLWCFFHFRFVSKYFECESENVGADEESLFAMAVDALKSDGIVLRTVEDIQKVIVAGFVHSSQQINLVLIFILILFVYRGEYKLTKLSIYFFSVWQVKCLLALHIMGIL